jgi:hypothetical protein
VRRVVDAEHHRLGWAGLDHGAGQSGAVPDREAEVVGEPEAGYITGSAVNVDGGLIAMHPAV